MIDRPPMSVQVLPSALDFRRLVPSAVHKQEVVDKEIGQTGEESGMWKGEEDPSSSREMLTLSPNS